MITQADKSLKKVKLTALISGILTAAICAVMNFVLIPIIESTTGGIRCFDMNFGYDYEDAVRFLELLSDEGRRVYLHIQLPLDFIYPIVYCVFFISVIVLLTGKKGVILPVTLAVSDYIENILSIVMLRSDNIGYSITTFASTVTVIKTVLMYSCFTVIAALIIRYLIKRKKR